MCVWLAATTYAPWCPAASWASGCWVTCICYITCTPPYIHMDNIHTDRQTDRRAHTHTHVHTSCIQVPNGQFGTRLQGGADAASPRYIFTLLNSLTRQVLTQTLNPLNPKPQFLLNSLTRRVLTSATTRCLSARSVSLLLACVSLPWPPGCLGCCHLCPLC